MGLSAEGESGEGESAGGGELVSSSSSISSPSSHSRLPLLPSLPPLHFSFPSPRGVASAVTDTGDAARRHVQLALRTADFWRRATGIYLAYKGKQAQEAALTSRALRFVPGSKPWDKERLEEELWKPHHEWAGKEMYELAVSVRGFYLKVRVWFGLEWLVWFGLVGGEETRREGGRERREKEKSSLPPST